MCYHLRPMRTIALLCAAGLAAAGVRGDPLWTFGTDGEGRLCLVAAVEEEAEVLEIPAEDGVEAVLSVGPRAFAGCPALREAVVPACVEWIDPDAFRDCPTLERITVEAGSADYSDVDGVLFDAAGTFLLSCPEGLAGDYVVPASTLEIDAEAFAGCEGLASVAIPAGVERIGADAFAGCPALVRVSLPADADLDLAGAGVPEGCRIVRYTPGALDDPTLPPRWEVRFAANGGTGTMAAQTFESGRPAALRACAFTRKGHRFAGWATSASGAAVHSDRKTVQDLAAAGERTTLYATWKPNRYTVRFAANGGKGTMADEAFAWGTAKKLRANAFTRAGYEFVGWAKKKGGAVAYKDAAAVKNLTAEAGGTVTLYAVWRGVVYQVVLHRSDSGGRTASQSSRYGTPKALRANPFTVDGRVFAGWAKEPGGAIAYKDGQTVSNLARKAGATVHLYARWAVPTFRVRFDANGGSGRMSDEGFRFGTAKRLRANEFVRKGFTFEGWSRTRDGAAKYADRQAVKNLTLRGGTVVLYAVWRRNRYTVRFLPNGGEGTMADEAFAWGKAKALRPCAFTRADCVFRGWAKSAKGAVVFEDGASASNLTAVDGKTVALYARWAKSRYTVRFDANGGTGTMADEAFAWGAAKKLRANAFSRPGFRFLGWARTPDAERPKFRDAASVKNLTASGGPYVLYAVWIPENDPSVVLCLGDSITQGFRCSGRPYPERLARMTGLSTRNYGVGGMTSAYGASIAEEAVWTERPGRVCILYGANDAIHKVGARTVKENLRTIVRICRENDCTPILATPTPQAGSHERFNDAVSEIASAVRALAREEGVALVDLNRAFGSGDGYLNPDDGLHLSDAGGDLLARMFRNAL